MPQTLEKTITINRWHGGMADVDLDEYAGPGQCSYVQYADIIESKPFLRPAEDPVDDSSGLISAGLIGRIRGYATRMQSSTQARVCAVDYGTAVGGGGVERLGVFQKENFADASWTALDHDETAAIGSSEPPAGCEFYDDDNLFFADSLSGSAISIGTCNIGTTTIATGWDILSSTAWGSTSGTFKGFLRHTDSELYFLKGGGPGRLGVYDGTTKPSLVTPATIPVGYEPVDMISYGNKILVVANSIRGGSSIILIRDPYQSLVYTFDDIYDTKIFRVCAVRNVAGRIILISADYDYKIYQWTGGDNVTLLKTLSVGAYNTAENAETQFTIRPQAVDVRDGILYFGTTFTVNATFKNGIYAFGFNSDGSTFLHNMYLDHTDDTASLRWRALKWYDDSASVGIVATAYDATSDAYRNMEIVIGSTRSAALSWESVWMRPFPGLKSQIIKCSLYHEDPGASGTITISHKKDADADYTVIGSASGDDSYKTVIGNNAVLRGTFTRTSTNTFTSGHKHKIKIGMTSGCQLEKIKLRVRTTEAE